MLRCTRAWDVNLGWAAEDCRALDAPAEVVGSD